MEIIRVRKGEASLTAQRPWLVAFAFGLLHGLSFAAALAEMGLPRTAIPTALVCFNAGVELSQLLSFAAALAETGLPRTAIPTALVCFNVGVELGQLLCIGTMLATLAASRAWTSRSRWSAPPWLWKLPPYLIGGLGSFWFIERISRG
ncbi:MAG: HupE/UreJ family protein [Betaproteobacteria bacterium]